MCRLLVSEGPLSFYWENNGVDKTTALRILLEPGGGLGRSFGLDSWNCSREIRRRIGNPGGLPADRFKGNSVQEKTGTLFLFTAGFSQNLIYTLPIGGSQESLDGPNVKYVTGVRITTLPIPTSRSGNCKRTQSASAKRVRSTRPRSVPTQPLQTFC